MKVCQKVNRSTLHFLLRVNERVENDSEVAIINGKSTKVRYMSFSSSLCSSSFPFQSSELQFCL